MQKARKPKAERVGADGLTDRERLDVRLWFGWGAMLGYDTSPRGYLREAVKPANKPFLLAMPRDKRKAVLRFVIAEHARRQAAAPEPGPC